MPIVTPQSAPAPQVEQQPAAPATGQAPIPEAVAAPQPEAPKEPAKEELLSPKFADLARKEKALRARFNDLKVKEEAYKSREAEYQKALDLEQRLLKDPLSVLNEKGITYDQLVNSQLNQPKPEELMIQKLQEEINSLKTAQESASKQNAEQQTQQYQQAVNQIRNDVKLLVQGNEEFSTIHDTNSQEAVVALIEETFNKQNVLLTIEEAAKEVETYLIEEAYRMAQLKKVQQRLMPKAPALAPKQEPAKQPQQMKTLTNAVAQTASRPLTARERRERAILAAQGLLKD